jgi:hypothetical protein
MPDAAGSNPAERTMHPWRNWISAAHLYREGCRFEPGRRLTVTVGGTRQTRPVPTRETLQVRSLEGQFLPS